MKYVLLVLLLLFSLSGVVAAGDFEDGKDALAHKDFGTAFQKFFDAEEAGHSKAQYMLGVLYTYGNGIPQDDVQAYKWFSVAAATATDQKLKGLAVNSRDAIEKLMTPHEIAKGKKMVRQWNGT